jgi:hypothetical protein
MSPAATKGLRPSYLLLRATGMPRGS